MTTPVDLAIADLGYKEEPPGSNITKYGKRFFPTTPSPWCAEMVSCNTRDSGAAGPYSASVGLYRNQAKQQGRLVSILQALEAIQHGKCVSVGFEWGHDTWPDHIGWLLGLGDGVGTIRTIEGNAPGPDRTDQVAHHQRSTTQVAFYCVVDPASTPSTPLPGTPPPVAPVYPAKPVLPAWMFLTWHPKDHHADAAHQFTNHGDKVAVLQAFFHALGGGWDPGPVDGIIGPKTNDIIGRFQEASHLTVDHVVGQATWRAAFG